MKTFRAIQFSCLSIKSCIEIVKKPFRILEIMFERIINPVLFVVGEPELDVTSEAHDILLANPDGGDFDSDEG